MPRGEEPHSHSRLQKPGTGKERSNRVAGPAVDLEPAATHVHHRSRPYRQPLSLLATPIDADATQRRDGGYLDGCASGTKRWEVQSNRHRWNARVNVLPHKEALRRQPGRVFLAAHRLLACGAVGNSTMDVQCERCKTEYEFDDALVSARGTTVRCTNCGHQFKVRRQEGGDSGGDRWLVKTASGQQFTFVTLRELQRAILAQQVSRGDLLRRAGAPPRSLGSISELEPFFEGRTTSNRPPPVDCSNSGVHPDPPDPPTVRTADGPQPNEPGMPVAFPKRSSITWEDTAPPMPQQSRPAILHGEAPPPMRRPIDTLRPPSSAVAAPPQAAPSIEPQPIVSATPFPGASVLLASSGMNAPRRAPMHRPELERPETAPFVLSAAIETSSPLPPPTQPVRRSRHGDEYDLSEARTSLPASFDEPYSMRRGRRVGGWIVALVLLLAVGVLGWAVARPYLINRSAAEAPRLDPRAESFLAEGERAMAEGNLEASQEALNKASVLAESDPRLRLDEARLANAQADVPWLKLKILTANADTIAGAVDELRTTRGQVDERVARAGRLADAALASSPEAPAAFRAKIDALRLAGQQSSARSYIAKVIAQASQPETAYVLAALDLAEPEPLWTTVIERLRLSAAGEVNGGRARAALVYALARSGDAQGAKAELAKLDALARPYPLLPSLRALVDKNSVRLALDAGSDTANPRAAASSAPAAIAPQSPQTPAGWSGGTGGGGEPVAGDTRSAMQTAMQAYKRGDFDRARQIYQAVVTRNPNDSEAVAALGDVARAQGNPAGALASYKRAIAVNPSYLPALLGLADTQWSNGDRASATRGYGDIVDRFPEGTYPAYVQATHRGRITGHPERSRACGPLETTVLGVVRRAERMNRSLIVASLVCLTGGAIGCEGRPRTASSRAEGARSEPHSGPSIAVLDLSDGVPEQAKGGLLGLSSRSATFDDLVQEVEHLDRGAQGGERGSIRGVLVRLGSAHIGLARAFEIGNLLSALGAKLPIWCHADEFANGNLALAARACKRVWISPASSVDALGLAMQTIYFHKLLADEIGLDVDFLQVGRFKGAEEPFTRDGPSPEARQSLESTLADLRSAWLEGLRSGRPGMSDASAEDGPYTPEGREGARTRRRRGLLR